MPKNKKIIAKESNQLVRAKYHLTRNEVRLMGLCAHKLMIKDIKRDKSHGVALVTITSFEYAELFKLSVQNASSNIRASLKTIDAKSIIFADPENDTLDHKGEGSLSWVIGKRDKPKRGSFEIALNPLIEEHLYKQEGGKFTLLDLVERGALSNGHFSRLYGTFCDHHREGDTSGTFDMSIPWMLERYDLPKSYERMSDFRRRFLHPAVKDISEHTPFNMIDSKGNMTIEELIPKEKLRPNRILFHYKYITNMTTTEFV